jgi:hypothetical protein
MDRRQEIEARNRRLEERGIIAVDDRLSCPQSETPCCAMALTRTDKAANPGFACRHNLSPASGFFCSATLAHTARLAKLYAV